MSKRRRLDDDDWIVRVNFSEIERLATSLVLSLGADAAASAFDVFRRLDDGQVVQVKNLEPRELRKKVRHLCHAFSLSPVDLESVPGVKPVVLSFRKPSDCPLKLAKCIKGYLKQAIMGTYKPNEEKEEVVSKEVVVTNDVTDEQILNHEKRMEAFKASVVDLQEEDKKETPPDTPAPEEEAPLMTGMLTLEEYRQLKEKYGNRMPTTMYTRTAEDQPQKSLMEMAQEGHFASSKAEVEKYMEERSKQNLWGKSAAAQRRKIQEINAKQTRRRNADADSDEGDFEPWDRFDRDKILTGPSRPATREDLERIMEMAAERKAAFKPSSGD